MEHVNDSETIFKRVEQGKQEALRASKDLEIARSNAKISFETASFKTTQPDRIRKEIKKLNSTWKKLSRESREYLDGTAFSFNIEWCSQTFSDLLYEAEDLFEIDGRRPLPLVGSIVWLLLWWEAQGNPVTNSLYSKAQTGDQPSETVRWLAEEIRKFRPETTEREIHTVLKTALSKRARG